MAAILTVNLAHPRPNPDKEQLVTGIDKRPTADAVPVRAPGTMHGGLGSGLVGDTIGDQQVHGGNDQAVYAYAREDLDYWQIRLDRVLPNGSFGENITTTGLAVTNALIGERWQLGDDGPLLEVAEPRIPCRTFAAWLEIGGWIKTFTAQAVPGAYLRVVTPGVVRSGAPVAVISRPVHDVTVTRVFRALTLEPELLPSLLAADALSAKIKERIHRRMS
ncbi:MAG: MOSC domain-containing protein [Mycobacterium sp.]|nr:MOSC domain-containing protein [Mycobacterium sp.]